MSTLKFVRILVTGQNGAYQENADPEYLKNYSNHRDMRFTINLNHAVDGKYFKYTYVAYSKNYTGRASADLKTFTTPEQFINNFNYWQHTSGVIIKFHNGEPTDIMQDDVVLSKLKRVSEPLAEWAVRDSVIDDKDPHHEI